MKPGLFVALVVSLLLGGASLRAIVRSGYAEELRAAAGKTARWNSSRQAKKLPSEEELRALPPQARRIVDFNCYENQEGGDVMGTANCFQFATDHLLSEAREDKERRLAGSIGLVVSLLMAGASLGLARLARRNDARLEAALQDTPKEP